MPIAEVVDLLGLDEMFEMDLAPRYNVAPSQKMPVLTNLEPNRLQLFRWGLIPFWAKDPRIGYKMINARAETLLEKPSFRTPVRKRRCLIPANGFFEWQKTPEGKKPHYIQEKGGGLWTFAGLWETWKDPEGKIVESYTIITCDPNEVVAPLHGRMPAVIPAAERGKWLDTEVPAEEAVLLLRAYPGEFCEAFEVSGLVNNPRNDFVGVFG